MYEYQCGTCGTRFERLSRDTAAAGVRCNCGSNQVERIWFSRVALAHGGSGLAKAEPCAAPDGCCGGACQMEEA